MAVYHNWTDDEIDCLNEGVRMYGTQFKCIYQNYLPHLTAQTIKNKYYKLSRKGSQCSSAAHSRASKTGINTPGMQDDQRLSRETEDVLAQLNCILKSMRHY